MTASIKTRGANSSARYANQWRDTRGGSSPASLVSKAHSVIGEGGNCERSSVMHPLCHRKLQPKSGGFVQMFSSRSVVAIAAAEQSELCRIARGLGEAEMLEGVRGEQPAARGALQIAALNQKRLDDVLDRI